MTRKKVNQPSRDQVLQALYRLGQQLSVDAHIPASDPDPIDNLIAVYSWETIRDSIIGVLADKNCQDWWEVAISALYPSISYGKPVENINYFIALMYACLKLLPKSHMDESGNTICSIVIKLKRIS